MGEAAKLVSLKDLMTFAASGAVGGYIGAALYQKVHKMLADHFQHEIGEAEKMGLTVGQFLAPIVGAVNGTWMGVATTAAVGPGLVPILAAAATGLVVGFMVNGVAAMVGWVVDRIHASGNLLKKTREEMKVLRECFQGVLNDLTSRLQEVQSKLGKAEAALGQADATLHKAINMEVIWQSYMSVLSWKVELRQACVDLTGIATESSSRAKEMLDESVILSRRADSAYQEAMNSEENRDVCTGVSASTGIGAVFLGIIFPPSLAVTLPITAGSGVGAVVNDNDSKNHRARERLLKEAATEASNAAAKARRMSEAADQSLQKCQELQREADYLERQFNSRL